MAEPETTAGGWPIIRVTPELRAKYLIQVALDEQFREQDERWIDWRTSTAFKQGMAALQFQAARWEGSRRGV